jgi:hypothetical protein
MHPWRIPQGFGRHHTAQQVKDVGANPLLFGTRDGLTDVQRRQTRTLSE